MSARSRFLPLLWIVLSTGPFAQQRATPPAAPRWAVGAEGGAPFWATTTDGRRGLHHRVYADGIEVTPGGTRPGDASWTLRLRTIAFGRDGEARARWRRHASRGRVSASSCAGPGS